MLCVAERGWTGSIGSRIINQDVCQGRVAGRLTIDGAMTPGFFTGIGSQANPGSTGNAGTVSVSAGTLSITNSGLISSSTSASGNGGSVTVSVAGGLTIDGAMTPFFTGITSQANPGSTGNAGTVSISAGTLSITNGGEISSSTFGFGNGGDVDVTVADGVTLSGTVLERRRQRDHCLGLPW